MTLTVQTDWGAIKTTLVAWAHGNSGMLGGRVLWVDQVGEREAKPYISLKVSSRGHRMSDDDSEMQKLVGSDPALQYLKSTHAGPRQMVLQVEAYSDPAQASNVLEANDYIERLMDSLQTQSVREAFGAVNIAFSETELVTSLDDQFGDRWERRSMADLTFNYIGEILDDHNEDSTNWIETVESPTEADGNLDLGE